MEGGRSVCGGDDKPVKHRQEHFTELREVIHLFGER